MNGPHAVVVGNPIEGIQIIGPFITGHDAIFWADTLIGEDWWIVPLESPEEHERNYQ